MVGLPVAVFLHNRFFGLLLFSLPRRSHQVRLPLSWLAPAIYQERLSFFGSAYISLRHHGTYTPRALCSAQLAGGCILITFMSSDIPARFIAPTPADSAKPLEPTTTLSSALLLLPPSRFSFLRTDFLLPCSTIPLPEFLLTLAALSYAIFYTIIEILCI